MVEQSILLALNILLEVILGLRTTCSMTTPTAVSLERILNTVPNAVSQIQPWQINALFGMTKELVNGNNCSSDGDQICDTPADPKLTIQNINSFCRYIGTETDSNGDSYAPDTKNIMSYSMKGCRSHFSEQQLTRMYAYFMTTKSYLACGGENSETKIVKSTNVKIYPNPITGDVIYVKQNNSERYMQEETFVL